jgi:hypothetical protein
MHQPTTQLGSINKRNDGSGVDRDILVGGQSAGYISQNCEADGLTRRGAAADDQRCAGCSLGHGPALPQRDVCRAP